MLQKLTLRIITTRLFLNSMSCLMGFFVWYAISDFRIISSTFAIPIYFDNILPEQRISAPERSEITLSGNRHLIQKSRSTGALHFNVQKLTPGTHVVFPRTENLLLPSAVKVINYNPIEIELTSL